MPAEGRRENRKVTDFRFPVPCRIKADDDTPQLDPLQFSLVSQVGSSGPRVRKTEAEAEDTVRRWPSIKFVYCLTMIVKPQWIIQPTRPAKIPGGVGC